MAQTPKTDRQGERENNGIGEKLSRKWLRGPELLVSLPGSCLSHLSLQTALFIGKLPPPTPPNPMLESSLALL